MYSFILQGDGIVWNSRIMVGITQTIPSCATSDPHKSEFLDIITLTRLRLTLLILQPMLTLMVMVVELNFHQLSGCYLTGACVFTGFCLVVTSDCVAIWESLAKFLTLTRNSTVLLINNL